MAAGRLTSHRETTADTRTAGTRPVQVAQRLTPLLSPMQGCYTDQGKIVTRPLDW